MMKANLFPYQKHPQIYGYTTDQYKETTWKSGRQGKGLIKIGYTERRNVEDRIKEQFPTLTPSETPYTLIFKASAITEDGRVFKDGDVHKRLFEKGICNVRGEWFECTKEEALSTIQELRTGERYAQQRHQTFGCRPEQKSAIELTSQYFSSYPGTVEKPSHFLWNAKMRFGKTFTAYQLSKAMGWKRVIVLTYKPAAGAQWKIDLESHVDFEGWEFYGPGSEYQLNTSQRPKVVFASFQDILGKSKTGKVKAKFEPVFEETWDCVFIDEYHFGAWRDAAKELYQGENDEDLQKALMMPNENSLPLNVKHAVYLSGTPFRALANGEFTEDQIFNWTYTDEQRSKDDFGDLPGNPYSDLPKMVLMTYQIPDLIREVAIDTESNEFDLNEFFRAERASVDATGNTAYRFVYEDQVNMWLNLLRGQMVEGVDSFAHTDPDTQVLPFKTAQLQSYLSHTFWFLPSVASCHAMSDLLKRKGSFYSNYEIVIAAGKAAGMGEKAIEPVKKAIGANAQNTKSITLSCGKLTTGVSIPYWTGIFMLRNTSSPETYFQAAFRVQTPWSYQHPIDSPERIIIKNVCYVFDFAPSRALRLISEYSARLNLNDTEGVTKKVSDFINFLPVLCYDGSKMQELNATELLDIAAAGTASSMLARRWQSDRLVNIDAKTLERLLNDPELLKALSKIEAFRNMSNLREGLVTVINNEKSLNKVKKSGEKKSKQLTEEEKEANKVKKDIKEKLKKFITRIPVFMYLTDFREETLKQVILNVEPELFTKVTGLSTDDFEKLCELGVFNSAIMNQAIFAFKRFEDSSLNYAGGHEPSEYLGGFDVIARRSDLDRL